MVYEQYRNASRVSIGIPPDDGSDSDDDSDSGGDEEADVNAMDLKGLEETDPEFFNFLQVRAYIVQPPR